MKKKDASCLNDVEMEKFKAALSAAIEVYSKGDYRAKQSAQGILDGWGRIVFIVSNNGKKIGLELTERLERANIAEEDVIQWQNKF